MKTGLFLPTLVSLGAYAAGAVQALSQAGIQFDVIGASSGGVITGAFAATGQIDTLVDLWHTWENKDIAAVDWRRLIRGGFFWAPSLLTNEPEHRTGIDPFIAEDKLLPGVRFRFHVSNLSTGAEEILEYPGAPMPFLTAVHAAVAVPGLFPTVDYQGSQYGDGAILNGSPLAKLMMTSGVERLFVVGVAPQAAAGEYAKNSPGILRSALEWNQFSETTTAIAQAQTQNELIRIWETDKTAVIHAIKTIISDPAQQKELLTKAAQIYDQSGFPYARAACEMIPILPQRKLEGLFGDFKPQRSRQLLETGRQDALRVLEEIM